jgi:hypothetical protein
MFPHTRHINLKPNVPLAFVLPALIAFAASCFGATQTSEAQQNAPQMTFHRAVSFAVSRPLRELAKLPPTHHYGLEKEHEQIEPNFHPGRVLGPAPSLLMLTGAGRVRLRRTRWTILQ